MAEYFFPGCRIKAGYPAGSEGLKEYMKKRFGQEPMGCCREDFRVLGPEDTALLICTNCICDLSERVKDLKIRMIPQMIDEDDTFPFPDYEGREMILQECRHGVGDIPLEDTARSLLKKMNVHTVSMEPKRRVPYGLAYPEHAAIVKKNAAEIPEGEVVTCCAICNLTMKQAGRRTHLLLDLLFGIPGEEDQKEE